MSELILCNRNFSASAFKAECGVDIEQVSSLTCPSPDMVFANKPYLLKSDHSALGATALAKLSNPATTKNLTDLSLVYGADNVRALSSITKKLKDNNIGPMAASTALMSQSASVYEGRAGGFVGAVKKYQSALMDYRQAVTIKSSATAITKQKVQTAFDQMQRGFQQEVSAVTGPATSQRGVPMNNAKRGLNIAKSSKNITKLDLVNKVEANNLVSFSKYAKSLGGGLALIDFGRRGGNIYNEYKEGGNWERELFIESLSMGTSAVAGALTVKAGLAIIVFATPAGWMGLVVAGAATAVTAAIAGLGVNAIATNRGGEIYDYIMREVSPQ